MGFAIASSGVLAERADQFLKIRGEQDFVVEKQLGLFQGQHGWQIFGGGGGKDQSSAMPLPSAWSWLQNPVGSLKAPIHPPRR